MKKFFLLLYLLLYVGTNGSLYAVIDDRTVLKIGPLEVSEYVVEKRFKPFQQGLPAGDVDNTAMISTWFEDFLVNQVVTAKALSEGYASHPEALATVNRMERHMLSAVNGPYYQFLLKDSVRSESDIRKEYEDDAETNASMPFEDYLRMIQANDLKVAVENHRNAVLDEIQFRLEQENCGELLERLRNLPPVPADIPPGLLENENLLLASYNKAGQIQPVVASEWIHYFSLLFIRSIPTRDATLRRSIEDMVIAEIDIRAARTLGLDQESQFVEDRKHFLNAQALDWFEKERLVPKIPITEEAIETFYRQHEEIFTRSVAAKGTLLRFEDGKAAMRWIQAYELNERDDQLAISIEELEVTQDHPIPSLETVTLLILNTQDERPIGPIATQEGVIVFLKQSSKKGLIPLKEATDYIVTTLTRDRLNALERELAPEYCRAFDIEDNIAYETYGATMVKTPWGNPD